MFKKIIIYIFLYFITIGIIFSLFFLTPKPVNSFPVFRFIIIIFATILLVKYFIYMIVSPWYDVFKNYKKYKKFNLVKFEPKVTVLVPAWNEEVGIITTLESLIANTYKNMEIIVIDNASTDNTYISVMSFIKKYMETLKTPQDPVLDIFCLKEETKGKGHALNKGIRFAKGEIIVSIDADCYVLPDTISNFVSDFNDPEVMASVGNVKIGNIKSIIGVVQYLEFLFSFYFKKSDSILGSIYIIGGAAGAFRKEVFEKIGVYDVKNITEDIDMSVRIQYAGMKIVYAEDAIVYTEGAAEFKDLVSQRLRWKRGRLETFLK
jgi:cellulose synthase/poly-beta-1,6-N-acetylglucosamine synthase-like glycosyltransferase